MGVERETDYVYHADLIGHGSTHDAVRLCSAVDCWQLIPHINVPFISKPEVAHFIAYHYHGDTTTIWILNDFSGNFTPAEGKISVASRDQIMVYRNALSRAKDLNMNFVVDDLVNNWHPDEVIAGGWEHGFAYANKAKAP